MTCEGPDSADPCETCALAARLRGQGEQATCRIHEAPRAYVGGRFESYLLAPRGLLGAVSERPWFHDPEWTRHAIALPEVVPLRCRRLYFAFLWPLRCFLDKGHEGPCHF